MLSGKFLFTLVGIVLAFLAICKVDLNNKPVVENFWGNSGAPMVPNAVSVITGKNGATTALPGMNAVDSASMKGSGKFVSVPSFQSVLSPRFSNVQYGANIRYNMPDRENLGAPCNPLTFGDMAKENYTPGKVKENYSCGTGQCGDSNGQSCGKGGYGIGHKVSSGYELPVGYTNGNYADVYNSLPSDSAWRAKPCDGDSMSNALPVGTMNTVNPEGQEEQFVVMTRLMNTNLKSKRRKDSDFIRGDLAIVPCQTGWFSVYPTISTDLNPGAMGVLGGYNTGESNSNLMDLLISSSGGSRTTFGGLDYSNAPKINMVPSYSSAVSAASTDVQVTAFP